jgi:lipoprotein-releasing system permease protein
MYKSLLCWRYLRTRYIALASIISVTLGVATMIVVNSVMAGFSREMQGRIHGILSDISVESHGAEGFNDPAAHMARIEKVAGKYIAGMTPGLSIPAMLSFQVQGNWHQRQVTFIGIDPKTYGSVGDFNQYLQHPANRQALEFTLRDGGYDTIDHEGGEHAKPRHRMDIAGWANRRSWAKFARDMQGDPTELREPVEDPAAAAAANTEPPPETMEQDGWVFERGEPLTEAEAAEMAQTGSDFDPTQETHDGIVMGMALACYRMQDGADNFFLLPGDDVEITVPTAGTPLKMVPQLFTIVDFYESKLSEYDSNLIFAPLASVQRMRETLDSATGIGSATSIQIKLRDEADSNKVRDLLRAEFPAAQYGVQTWRDKQGPLLAAVTLETTILNLLLFMIIAVAGFGILAIFYMIVVEKTRDIGILKSLGAPSRGIQGVFLAYGLGLGIVGSGVGMVLGLSFVANINHIADGVAAVTGQQVFDPTVYYFQEIPVIVQPFTVAWIVVGAMLIAVLASILPARRAATLHPVEALRNKQ